jgi:hypothetical protein
VYLCISRLIKVIIIMHGGNLKLKYSYMFRCICIICTEPCFLFAKIAKSVRLQNQQNKYITMFIQVVIVIKIDKIRRELHQLLQLQYMDVANLMNA